MYVVRLRLMVRPHWLHLMLDTARPGTSRRGLIATGGGGRAMLVELSVMEQRYHAVMEVISGAVTEVARLAASLEEFVGYPALWHRPAARRPGPLCLPARRQRRRGPVRLGTALNHTLVPHQATFARSMMRRSRSL
jgi:hypothetical protein